MNEAESKEDNIRICLIILLSGFVLSGGLLAGRAISLTISSHTVLAISNSSSPLTTSQSNKTRTYYIAADEVVWNYAPTGINKITGKPFDDNAKEYVQSGPNRIGGMYLKSLYREYTDNTFTKLKPVPPKWQHLGILGPVIRAEVGDTIKVVFKNNLKDGVSMHPHGVFYLKNSEGAPYNDSDVASSVTDKADDSVVPGGRHIYTWLVPVRAGPGPNDPSSIVWSYHSHTNETSDENAGLIGPIIITRQGMANPDGSPKDVDREFVTLYMIFDENKSPYLMYNIQTYAKQPSSINKDNPMFMESNMKHSINGYLYGNLPGLNMKEGDRVRWYVIDMGGKDDMHTAHWHGQTLLWNKMRVDVTELMPASTKTLDMVPDDPGTWLYHCHVNDHLDKGMQALFTVTPMPSA
ncbi:MAG TPA: multicopper oxidase domain-containing protein [Nitrososphaeraceae archaeon]|nr:multicopper oxidase domain-containing protein [Nitrososphaeraceae archaeon]